MKKILFTLTLVCGLTLAIKAVDQSTTIDTATKTSLVQGKFHLTSLEVINNAAATQQVWFYDAPTNVLTYTLGAYTNWSTYTTNIVVTTTNYNGVVETSTNLATWTGPYAHAATTNNYRIIKSFTVAAGGTATWQPTAGVYLNWGLCATNTDTNLVVNITYSDTQ